MANDHEEIIRVRDSVHDLRGTLNTTVLRVEVQELRLTALEDTVATHVTEYEAKVDELVESDTIAEAVATKLAGRNRLELTWIQRLGAFVLFCVALTDFVYRITG